MLDYLDHAVDVLGRTRVVVGALDAQGVHLPQEALDVMLRQLAYTPVASLGNLDYAVLYVRKVLNVMDRVALALQVAAEHVKYYVGQGMAYVARAVQVGAAHVHGYLLPQGRKVALFAGEGVVQPHATASTVAIARAAMPSPRPGNPRPSVVVHLMLTCAGGRPNVAAIVSLMFCK